MVFENREKSAQKVFTFYVEVDPTSRELILPGLICGMTYKNGLAKILGASGASDFRSCFTHAAV